MKIKYIIDALINSIVSMICFVSIYICHYFLFKGDNNTLIIAAFGASSVLVFSKDTHEYSFVSILLVSGIAAGLGVCFNLSGLDFIYKVSLAIGSCILLLNLSGIHYPPAGAIILIPLIAGYEIKVLGYMYIIFPTLTGITIIHSFSKLKEIFINYGK